jgi:hypothetical protein
LVLECCPSLTIATAAGRAQIVHFVGATSVYFDYVVGGVGWFATSVAGWVV